MDETEKTRLSEEIPDWRWHAGSQSLLLILLDSNSMQQTKPRNSNLELYRIIVMLLIVAHHYVVNSGLITVMEETPLSARSIFFYLFGAWGKIGINCFILITGYFMCKSQITLQKFMKLLLEVIFYNIVIYAIFILSGYHEFTFAVILDSLPGLILKDNFTTCFLVFYLCIPFLNVLVQNLSKKQHLQLVALALFSILSIPPFLKPMCQ